MVLSLKHYSNYNSDSCSAFENNISYVEWRREKIYLRMNERLFFVGPA